MARRAGGDVKQPLTRGRILNAALDLADRDGAGAVTMRRVARALGVEAMSLYHHIRDREDLLDGLAETMVRTGLPAPPPGLDVRALLTWFARGIRDSARAHPHAFHLVGLRPLRSADAAASITALLQALASNGMEPDDAVTAYRVTAAYARGFALAETGGLTLGQGSTTPVPAALGPFVAALTRDTGEVFEAGLEVIIKGFTLPSPVS